MLAAQLAQQQRYRNFRDGNKRRITGARNHAPLVMYRCGKTAGRKGWMSDVRPVTGTFSLDWGGEDAVLTAMV